MLIGGGRLGCTDGDRVRGAWVGPGCRSGVAAGSTGRRVQLGGGGGAGVQAARGPQTVIAAGALRVVVPRPAAGNACRALVLWSRCRSRSMVTRRLPRSRRAAWRRAAVRAAGRLAVAAPVRMVVMAARRAAVKEISRGCDGLPGAAALAGRGGVPGRLPGGGADELGGGDPGGVLLADHVRAVRPEDRARWRGRRRGSRTWPRAARSPTRPTATYRRRPARPPGRAASRAGR